MQNAPLLAMLGLLPLLAPHTALADELFFKNGDRWSGTIVSLEKGRIRFRTELVGQLEVAISQVETLSADSPVEIHMTDGTILVDRVGRLVRESDWWTFTFETGGDGQAEPPIRLLPSRLLERMEIESTGGTDRVQFLVSGEVTTFRSMSFLLLRKVLRKRNLGNLR